MCIAEKRQTNSRDKKQLDAHQPENVQHAYVWCTPFASHQSANQPIDI